MKKLVLFAAVVFGLSTMNAQKNSILLGGNVGYNHTENKFGGNSGKEKLDTYEWAPYLGYQFTDHLTIGAKVAFTKADLDSKALQNSELIDGDTKTSKIGGFIRYSQPLSETFAVYADLGAGWKEEKTKGYNESAKYENKADGFYIGFNPALFINFKNNFGLNFSIGGVEYNHLKEKGSKNKSNGVDVTFGNAFNIGISKNFSL
jgi:hypothetical protein